MMVINQYLVRGIQGVCALSLCLCLEYLFTKTRPELRWKFGSRFVG